MVNQALQVDGKTVSYTVSMGLGSIRKQKDQSIDELFYYSAPI